MGHRPHRGTNLSVPGGRTHLASQGAFGNSCRGGRMFSAICFDFDLRVPIIMSSSPSADKAETIEEKLKQ
ncbi:hypothetical protein RHGRI_006292 [Rhododendron griersonianum]|uniref:Uncharacterized protein n=1 Tax=Rhododendron griersonianum TaxID=479676 RepID=A0AAV6KSG2_9ERIC|nr:hypothetical protein RHGRI_006292 [Rhododendron griersonianum]